MMVQEPTPVPRRRPSERPGSPRVLLVESVRETREILSLILTLHGVEVTEARTIPTGLRMASWCEPEVVVTGLARPAKNAAEAVRSLRSSREIAQIPVVVILPQHGSWAVPLDEWLPPEQILRMPVDPEHLVRSIRRVAALN